MPLRPINAIFVEPKAKVIVIYQNGALWQLTRMKIDKNSWQRRTPYKGKEEALFVMKEQKITDPFLAQKIPTESLPATILGASMPKFVSWWRANGYKWLKDKKEDIHNTESHSENTVVNEKTVENSDTVDQQAQAQPQVEVQKKITPQIANTEGGDAFDNLLSDWEEW